MSAEYSFDVELQPDWFVHGLCGDIENRVRQKRLESKNFIGPIKFDVSDPYERAMRNVGRAVRMMSVEERDQLEQDLRYYDPFLEEMNKTYKSRNTNIERVAKMICAACPVFEECRDYGLQPGAPDIGIYGGLNSKERAQQQSRQQLIA